jgi:hemolysin D
MPAAPKKPPKAEPPTSGVMGRDREFLPAALEILETPPSPLPVAMMLTICGIVFLALVWSFFGRLDVHAVAPGKIETAGHAKVIQPLDPRKVLAIHVKEGDRVKALDLLVEFDPQEAAADERAAADAMYAARAEEQRRRFAAEAIRSERAILESTPANDADIRAPLLTLLSGADEKVRFDADMPEYFRIRERGVLRAELTQLGDVLANIDKQMAQKMATRQRLNMSIAFQMTLIETLTQRVSTRQQAIDLQVGTKINLYDAKEQLERSQAALASDQGQLIETEAALRELQSQKTKALSQFIADNENRGAEAARKADEAQQNRSKAQARLARTRLYAPTDGVVQQLALTTVGQVVTTGQQLMVVTPHGGQLQVEALLSNIDVGFVHVGQTAVVKVDAFPFTRFGVLRGKIVSVAAEAIDEQAAKRLLANAASGANAGASQPSSAPGQPNVFVFPVIIELDDTTIKAGDTIIPVVPGMTVTAEVRTHRRRVIDYFLSPIAKMSSEAFREF